MTQEQEKQIKKKVIEILTSDSYKNSACTQHSSMVVQEVIKDMQANNVQSITDAEVMQYFSSVFFDMELGLQKVDSIRAMTNPKGVLEPKNPPVTAKFSEEAVKRLGWKIGRLWRIKA